MIDRLLYRVFQVAFHIAIKMNILSWRALAFVLRRSGLGTDGISGVMAAIRMLNERMYPLLGIVPRQPALRLLPPPVAK